MTETLAALLLTRLTGALPYLDRAVGLARVYEFTIPNGDAPRRLKLPVPLAYTAADCERDPYYLVPDAATGSILFFEDAGTVSQGAGKAPYERTMESTVRLLIWLNPDHAGNPATELDLIAGLYNALRVGERHTIGPLADLLLSWTIQPAGAGLFGAYSFAGDTPLLYPPFRLFGAEIKARYRFVPGCFAAPVHGLPTITNFVASVPAPATPALPTIANFIPTPA